MRGFSIILVVLGHVLLEMGIGGEKSILSSVLMSFRMPLFFFVSGFFSFRIASWWNRQRITDILRRKIYAQIFGTIIFFSIHQYAMSGSVDFSDGFKGYWFTIVLFQMYLLYLAIALIDRVLKHNYTLFALAIISVIGALIFHSSGGAISRFFCWQNLNHFLQFFIFGIICSKYRKDFFSLLTNNKLITCVIIGLLGGILIWPSTDLQTRCFPLYYCIRYEFSKYAALLIILIMFYGIKSYWGKDTKFTRCMIFIGQRTLDIYFIHFFFLPNLRFMESYLSSGNMLVIQLLISSIITSIVILMSMLISSILRKSKSLELFLFGVKRRIA